MPARRGGPSRASASGSLSRSAGFDDIPKDDEDRFEAGRDQILLDENQRQIDSDDDMDVGLNQREVLGVDRDQSEDSEDYLDEDEELDAGDYDDEDDYQDLPSAKAAKKATLTVSSDDDDDLLDDDDDEDDDEMGTHENDRGWGANKRAYYNTNDLDAIDSDSDIDEEEARELELKEVRRLQKKSRSAMEDADFGLGDDDIEGGVGRAARDAGRQQRRKELDQTDIISADASSSAAKLAVGDPASALSDPASRQNLLAGMQKQSPETVALAGEYADMLEELAKVDKVLKQMSAEQPDGPRTQLVHLLHQTLVTYLTTITFYFHLRVSPEYVSNPAKLRDHPVLTRMMRLKQGLSAMEDMGLSVDRQPLPGSNENGEEDLDGLHNLMYGSEDEDLGELDEDELAGLLADEKENASPKTRANASTTTKANKQKKANGKADPKAKKSQANGVLQQVDDDDDDEHAQDWPGPNDGLDEMSKASSKKSKKKKKASKDDEQTVPVVAPLAAGLEDLNDEPAPEVRIKKQTNGTRNKGTSNPFAASSSTEGGGSRLPEDATFGELSELSAIDSAERAARKRTLQFHASAIENKALQRSKAAKERQSGDADIPYRDRERSKAAVESTKAAREAKLNQQLSRNTDLDGDDGWGESDEKDWRDVMGQSSSASGFGDDLGGGDGDEDGDDDAAGYYDLIASSRKRARADAKAEYDDARNAERFALMEDEELEDGQHRGITRQIEKNKGLTPHRPKTSRNPRVKKRLKYEQAKKRLGSRQAVFKGGQSSLQGGYGGESSGISTHLVKSRKLG